MGKSGRVRLGDLRRSYRLIHECRDVGHEPDAWPAVLVGGLVRLVDAHVVLMGEIHLAPTADRPKIVLLAETWWPTESDRSFWYRRYHTEGGFRDSATFQRFAALGRPLSTRGRDQLVG